jgi:hypothetical protein
MNILPLLALIGLITVALAVPRILNARINQTAFFIQTAVGYTGSSWWSEPRIRGVLWNCGHRVSLGRVHSALEGLRRLGRAESQYSDESHSALEWRISPDAPRMPPKKRRRVFIPPIFVPA